jgi:hypothetical protein
MWIAFSLYSLIFHGVWQTILNWITLHIIVLRVAPRLFGLTPLPFNNYVNHVLLKAIIKNRRYVWYRLQMEQGFSESEYRAWLQEKIASDPDMNHETV